MTNGQRNALIIVAVGCVIGIVFGFSLGRTGTTKPKLPPPFAQIFPPPGDLDLRQVEPVVVLRAGYTADLTIDGQEVVEQDVQRVEALHSVTYRPGPESDIGRLGAGRHCVTAVARGEADHQYDSATYRWCFNLH